MGGCGSKPEQRSDGGRTSQARAAASSTGAAVAPPVQQAVHSDIVNDVIRGGAATEIISAASAPNPLDLASQLCVI